MGRMLHRKQGVPVSGAMDALSARLANIALGNEDNAAVIEFTYANAAFEAESDLLIAFSGDGADLKAGKQALLADRPVFVPAGTSISLTNNPQGSRTYLAVAGGWDVPEALGSRSTYITAAIGGFYGRALEAGDQLKSRDSLTLTGSGIYKRLQGKEINFPKWSIAHALFLPEERKIIRVVQAHEFAWFKSNSIFDFFSSPYILSSKCNRMGYQLAGKAIERLADDELLSTAVAPGTIQVTNNGSLVILMADCQTTGGYPRIAQVAAVDLPLCGQLKPGDAISFTKISGREAEMLYIGREKQLQQIKQAVSYKVLV